MFSNVELIVLSLISEKPSYAYEIEKQIESRNMRLWVKIGIASIYQVLDRLYRKGYALFEVEREGKAPERKRYYITPLGTEQLKASVKASLVKLEWYYLDLNAAIEGSHILEQSELSQCLAQRLALVRNSLQKLRALLAEESPRTVKQKAVMRNVLLFREAEERFLSELLDGPEFKH